MNNNVLLRYAQLFDLLIISVWAVSVFCSTDNVALFIPVVLLRIAVSFTLSRRQKNAVWLIVAFSALCCMTVLTGAADVYEVVLRPFARMYDCVTFLVQGHSTLLEGAYQYLGNNGGRVPEPGYGWIVWTALWLAWIVLEPIVVFLVLAVRRKLVPVRWQWGRIFIVCLVYAVFVFVAAWYDDLHLGMQPNVKYFVILFLLLLPAVMRVKMVDIPADVLNYCLLAGIFTVAFAAGAVLDGTFSLVAAVVTPVSFYYFASAKTDIKKEFGCRYVIAVSGFVFWIAQYATNGLRVFLLVASAICVGYVAYRLYHHTRRAAVSLSVFFVCAFILPSVSIGYNQYNAIGAKRWLNYDGYYYSSRGLLYVLEDGLMGIRDRYGIIMPCAHEWVKPLGDKMKPYVKFQDGWEWGVYDLERQEVVVNPEYKDIFQYDNNVWRLVSEDGNDKFFVAPRFYYRFK